MAQEAHNSGIQNAEVRYKKQVGNLSTQAHIRARSDARLRNDTFPSEEDQQESTARSGVRSEQLANTRLQMEAERIFQEEGVAYEKDDIAEILKANTPDEPSFPFFIILLAIIKDILDALTLSGVGYVISFVTSILIGAIIFIWIISKGKAPWRKKHVRKSIERFVVANLADLVPLLNILPIETIFVLMVYSDEKQLTENIRGAFGRLQQFKRFLRR